jgi:hypothetical protein
MKRFLSAVAGLAMTMMASGAVASPHSCLTNSDCFGPGETCASNLCQAQSCGHDDQCGGGMKCVATHCVSACSTDADCASGQACFAATACLPVMSVTLPDTFGLVANGQPSCDGDAECQGTVDCVAPLGGGASHCRIGSGGSFKSCGNVNFKGDVACPGASGYVCGALEGSPQTAFCESSASCTTQADCTSTYPVTGHRCIQGRCSQACAVNSDCPGSQPVCLTSPGALSGGMCVASTLSARLFTFHLGQLNPDTTQSLLAAQRTFVFLSDGFRASDLPAFSRYARDQMQRLMGNVDVVSPLFASLFNLFVLEVPDNVAGLGQQTRFGHFESVASTTGDMPGSGAQTHLFSNLALDQWADAFGPTPTSQASASILFYNTGAGIRAHGGGGLIVQPTSESRAFTLTHELGHMVGSLADEYVQGSDVNARKNVRQFEAEDSGTTRFCGLNMISRRRLTGCNRCSGSDDVTFPVPSATLAELPWFPFLNESNALGGTFSTTNSDPIRVNGLFVGAGASFDTEMLRPSSASFMRNQEDAHFFNRASVEGFGRVNIAGGKAATIRRVAVGAPEPTPLSDGPLQAIATSTRHHRTFFSMKPGASASDQLSVLSGLTLEHERDIPIPAAPGAETPRVLVLDDARDRLIMRSRSTTNPDLSKLMLVDTDVLSVTDVVVPDLFGFPGVDPTNGDIYIQTRNSSNSASLLRISNTSAALDAPTSQPFFSGVPLVGASQSVLLLVAGTGVLNNAFCNATHCDVWAVDTAAHTLLSGQLSVDMTGESVPPAIQLATIGKRPDGSETLVLASSSHIRVWELGALIDALRAGTSPAPDVDMSHTLGQNDVPLSGLAWVNGAGDDVVLGNRAGALTLFHLDGATAEPIVLEQMRSGMQILGVNAAPTGSTSQGFAVVTAAAFDGPRIGVTAVLDLATPAAMLPVGRGRVLFEQPLAAAGLSAPGSAWDDDWGLIYTTGVIDAGEPGQADRYQTPVIRGPAALQYSGCP